MKFTLKKANRKISSFLYSENVHLVFENGNYRTTGLNEAVALIGLFQKELGNKKAERLIVSDKTFGDVPRIGLEPTYLAAPEPKSGVSTNFTIWAKDGKIIELLLFYVK